MRSEINQRILPNAGGKSGLRSQEMKEQQKDSEGDPTTKSQRRSMAENVARNQLAEIIPEATVVLVNPTHYAVVLKWDQAETSVPCCTAKGIDERAKAIRELAKEHNVPIYRDPITTRRLYNQLDIGQEIDSKYFQAVAVAIHFALKTSRQ